MKKCQFCGQEFKAGFKGRRKFCSDACAQKYHYEKTKNKYRKNLKCKICGKPIEGRGYFYCSDECRKVKAKENRLKSSISLFSNSKDKNPSIEICLNCTKNKCVGTCELIEQERLREEQSHGKPKK